MHHARPRRTIAALGAAALAAAAAVMAADAPPVAPPAPPSAPGPATTSPAAGAAAAPTAAEQAAVDAAIAQLTHADWRKRDAAQRELLRLGDAAAPTLERVAKSAADDRVRSAARGVLSQIAEARVIGPSLVTLHLKDAKAKDAFAALAKQSSAPLKASTEAIWDDLDATRVTIDLDRQPFWVAMRELSRQTLLELRVIDGEHRLVQGDGQRPGRAAVSGAFVVEATRISRTRSVDLTADDPVPADDQFGMDLVVRAEPRLTVLRAATTAKLAEAFDENGNSLLPEAVPEVGGEDVDFGAMDGAPITGGYDLYVPLKYPAKNPGRRIAKLRGSVVFTIQLESRAIEVKDLRTVDGQSRVVNGVRFTFAKVTGGPDEYKLVVSTNATEATAAEMWRGAQGGVLSRLKLLDAAGRPLEPRGYVTNWNEKDGTLEWSLDFGTTGGGGPEAIGPPTKLTWEVPTRTRDVTVPFEFKDVRLP